MPEVRIIVVCFFLLSCAACSLPARDRLLTDAVISRDTVWDSDVRIRGVVVVKKNATLTIRPGTRVLFEKIDHDGDGIGDSELLVEGGLRVLGTADQPVVMSSASESPQPGDWKYLYLDFASPSVVEHLVSEYAYSGIQIHFSRAVVKNSVFRHNVDGVRFSTVNLALSGNRIYNNQHGLRYEGRNSTAAIHLNDIRENDIGIFVVTRSDDRVLIEANNIDGNRKYNVKIGFDQHQDVTFPRNWWGTSAPQEISACFFDKTYDDRLGRVHAVEPLDGPVKVHGQL